MTVIKGHYWAIKTFNWLPFLRTTYVFVNTCPDILVHEMRSKRDERVVEPITKTRKIGQLDEIRKSAKIGYS